MKTSDEMSGMQNETDTLSPSLPSLQDLLEGERRVSVASSDQSQDSDVLSELPDIEIIVEREQQDREATNQVQEIPKKSSTAKPAKIDLGNSMKCNTCHILLSSKNVISHAEQKHGITGKRIRALAKFHTADSDSLFANSSNLQKGDILVTRQGQRITLVEVMENGNWMTQNTTTGLEAELDLISNVDLRYLGQLENLETTLASSSIISSSLGEVSISGQSSNVTSTNANSNFSHDDTDSRRPSPSRPRRKTPPSTSSKPRSSSQRRRSRSRRSLSW